MSYTMRAFTPADAPALSALTLASIKQLGTRAYSPEQVAAWASRHHTAERFVERHEAGAFIKLIEASDGSVAMYGLIEQDENGDGHFDMLYGHPDHTGQGLAQQLIITMGINSKNALGITRFYTEASELAKPVFESVQYKVIRRRDFEIEGPDTPVLIHNYAMERVYS